MQTTSKQNYERASERVIDALVPELKKWVSKWDGEYWIHSPLLITSGLANSDPVELNEAYERMKSLADRYRANVRFDPLAYLVLIKKPYRLDAFVEIRDRLSDAQYWRCLEYVWSISEATHRDFPSWLHLLQSTRCYRPLMMSREDRRHFATFPETLTIYRGYQHGKNRHKMGLSWTLSKEQAAWFAYRWYQNGKPMVATGSCQKADVFCYTDGRKEQEIVIDPACVTNVKRLKDIGPSPFKD